MAEETAREWNIVNAATGADMVTFTSILEFADSHGGSIAKEKLEEGGFASFHKTAEPVAVEATLGITGTVEERQAALDTLTTLREGLDLFSFVTPEREYENMNLVSFSQPKRANNSGANILIVSLSMEEVRTVTSQYTTVKLPASKVANPDDAGAQKGGTRQASSASDSSSTSTKSRPKDWASLLSEVFS